jgi:hypothetical protein
LGWVTLDEVVVAGLNAAGHEFDDQQAVGDVPDRAGVVSGARNLHPGFIEVLDDALSVR